MVNDKIKWLGKPEARILSIRKFRQFINTLPFDDAAKLTQKNWMSSPRINNFQFDLTNVNSWPNPWELFSQQIFCANSQVLGAFYTLLLSEHAKEHDISLVVLDDVISGIQGAIVCDDYPIGNEFKVVNTVTSKDISNKLGE